MTVSTTNTEFAPRTVSGFRDVISRFFSGLGSGYSAYLAYNNLNRMSDRQLADIGLTRIDIPRAAAADILR